MTLLLTSLFLLLGGAAWAALPGAEKRGTLAVGAGVVIAASILMLTAALPALRPGYAETSLGGAVGLDSLSSLFFIPLALLGAAAAVFGAGYLRAAPARLAAAATVWLLLLIACMALVLIARRPMLFLMAWEGMAISSFALVMFEDEKEPVRRAGWIYMAASQIGVACLLPLLLLMDSSRSGPPVATGALLLLSLVGFGTKAGIAPLHVWLPEAHPAAPSHVSALMSGVMIKMGLYGLLRTVHQIGPPPCWYAWTLIALGLGTGLYGVINALVQRDLKRILAYSSIENIGLIVAGIGLALLGAGTGNTTMAVLAWSGVALHIVHHAMAKGLLFLAAGSVLHGTGTGELDLLGGLFRRMPRTGRAFLCGAATLSGLPPLNGFAGECLLAMAAFHGVAAAPAPVALWSALVLTGLALISALAVAVFTRMTGVAFLGHPRSDAAAQTHEAGPALLAPMGALAALCIGTGFAAPWIVVPLSGALSGLPGGSPDAPGGEASFLLFGVTLVGLALVVFAGLVALLRTWMLSGRTIGKTVIWDCGYLRPSARTQYSGSSFIRPLALLFGPALRLKTRREDGHGFFPAAISVIEATPDFFSDRVFKPLAQRAVNLTAPFRALQSGRLHLYILYILITLVALLAWRIR